MVSWDTIQGPPVLGPGLPSFLQGVAWLEWSEQAWGPPDGLEGSQGRGWVWAQARFSTSCPESASRVMDGSPGVRDGAAMPPVGRPWLSAEDAVHATSCGWPLLATLSHRPPRHAPLCLFAAGQLAQMVSSVSKDRCDRGPHPNRNPVPGDRSRRGLCSLRASLLGRSKGQECGGRRKGPGLTGQPAALPPVMDSFLAWAARLSCHCVSIPGLPESSWSWGPARPLCREGQDAGRGGAGLQPTVGRAALWAPMAPCCPPYLQLRMLSGQLAVCRELGVSLLSPPCSL